MKNKKSLIVNTQSGQLKGVIQRSWEGYDYLAFKGIPYAKPPVGELRFEDPIPIEPWQGVRDATNYGPAPIQIDFIRPVREILGSEDCLYLNVFVKSINDDKKLPVIVYVPGGLFMYGSGDDVQCGPDYLLRKDVVLVTVNYRLGIFGFLNLEDEAAPGNQGLKDVFIALKWIKKNIENFGGDPNNITIFGVSAGAALAHYLALSDKTKGLFHRAILQSGVSCNPWACSSNKQATLNICRRLGMDSTDPKEIVKFLRTVDCNTLVKQQNVRLVEDKMMSTFMFSPGIDDKSKEPFMPIHPGEAMKKGAHVPILLGFIISEGKNAILLFEEEFFKPYNDDFERYLPEVFKNALKDNNTTPKQLKEFYFGDKEISSKNMLNFINLQTDIIYHRAVHRVITYQVNQRKSLPTYCYIFTYDKGPSVYREMAKITYNRTPFPGAAHFDDIGYLFKTRYYDFYNVSPLRQGSTSYRIMEQMTEMWFNFAAYGDPTPVISDLIPVRWHPVTNDKVFQVMNIGDELKMENITSLEILTSEKCHANTMKTIF